MAGSPGGPDQGVAPLSLAPALAPGASEQRSWTVSPLEAGWSQAAVQAVCVGGESIFPSRASIPLGRWGPRFSQPGEGVRAEGPERGQARVTAGLPAESPPGGCARVVTGGGVRRELPAWLPWL